MSRKELPLPWEHIPPFDLERFVKEAAQLNQHTLEACTIPFPQAPEGWLFHYQSAISSCRAAIRRQVRHRMAVLDPRHLG